MTSTRAPLTAPSRVPTSGAPAAAEPIGAAAGAWRTVAAVSSRRARILIRGLSLLLWPAIFAIGAVTEMSMDSYYMIALVVGPLTCLIWYPSRSCSSHETRQLRHTKEPGAGAPDSQ